MFTKYDEYELLELFENEPVVISEKEAGRFIYSKSDSSGISIMLAVSIYDKECEICLSMGERLIFETNLKKVDYLQSKDKCLRIHQNESIQDYLIYFGLNIFVKTEATHMSQEG